MVDSSCNVKRSKSGGEIPNFKIETNNLLKAN